jgi:hypothetical protein
VGGGWALEIESFLSTSSLQLLSTPSLYPHTSFEKDSKKCTQKIAAWIRVKRVQTIFLVKQLILVS